jgi:acetyl-CoA carboxylase biotin carboxyl carrier protein
MSRASQSVIDALLVGDELRAPAPGYFRTTVAPDHLVAPGDIIGELELLGRTVSVVARTARGLAKLPAGPALARRPVSYGDVLVTLATDIAISGADPSAASSSAARATDGLVFRAPTSGRFYGRPTPDKPAFVEVGQELATGATVCLLEVMKTFHRVTFSGADVPARAKVREILVADGADVNQGDPLLALEPLP